MTDQTASAVFDSRLVVRATLRTDVGKVRSENQDFGTLTNDDESRRSRKGRLLVVADGMGGHRGGATASRLAGETVKAKYLDSSTDDIPSALREALTLANRRIFNEAQSNPDLRGMGTTTSALAVRDGKGWFAHVGDSRIYLVRGDEIKQLTDDHSLVATMMREGLLTAKEAENHPRRNVLQRSIGVGEDVEIDVRGPFELREGDMFILCSDGLHGLVKEDELKEVARLGVDEAADEFLRRALDRGAPDNVTVIVARVERRDGVAEDETVVEAPVHGAFDETISDDTMPGEPLPGEMPTEKLPKIDPAEIETDKIPAFSETGPGASPLDVGESTYEAPLPKAAAAVAGVETAKTAETPLPASTAKTTEVALDDRTVRIASRTTESPAPPIATRTAEVRSPMPAAKTLPGGTPVRRSSGSSVLKWTVIFVLILGAAGVGLFLYQQQGLANSPTTTSHK